MLRLYLAVQAVRAIAHILPPFVSESEIGHHELGDANSNGHWSSPLPHCASLPGLGLSRRQEELNPWGNNDLTGNIGSTSGCPQSRRTAYIGVAADCAYTASFDSTDDARQHITDVVNTASVVFENSFNISIVVQNITLSDPECPADGPDETGWNAACTEGDTNWRLREFSSWRNSFNDNYAYWTLFTGCSSSSGEVGVSWVGALCSSGRSSEAGANVVARTQSEWQVFAHESAHTFGAAHDCTSETCGTQSSQCCPLSSDTCSADGRYIMNPVSNTGMTRFSPCTIGTVCSRMGSGRVDSSCLNSRSGNRTDSGQCGNGIVEAGEACDCGNGACNSRDGGCCDSLTCQWRGGGQCDSSGTGPGSDDDDGDRTEDSASSWVSNHLHLVIGLAAGVGGALILFIFALVVFGCRGNKKKKMETGKIETRQPEH